MNHPARSGRPELARARWLLMGLFALTGITFSSWLARLPTVRDSLDLSTAELGGILLVGSVGALLTVTASGMVVQRFGSRRALLASTAVLAVGYVLMGLGPTFGSVLLLAVGIFLNGVAVALGNVPINVESGRIERAMGRTVIPQFHAAFSIGAVTGSALGAAASHLDVPVATQFSLMALVAVVWRLASLRGVVLPYAPDELPRARAPLPATRPSGRRRIASALDSWREPRTLLIGLVVMAAALSEGSANDWLSLAVVDGFDRTEAIGGIVLGLFVASMTVVRLLGTRLLDRFGRVAVLRASGLVSIVGLLLFGFAPSLPLAGVGVALWGFGAALAVPVGIAAASDDPLKSAGRVAVVSSFASVASIAAPPLLGLAAESIGARHALTLIAVAMVVSVLLARQVAPERRAPAPAADGPAAAVGPRPEPVHAH
ncbi:MFS transporter [Cellulomonas edaphi]|uniref:MFS transporter n=1 Tax=Cellulomonas edaphi TaxID=3053468 RepID=A0ABT7S9D3_9CELL|nr:MFS transporter [Cellulomons edaphi]MDM7832191.1 MFS transporter [Cellulomons edaphi]